MITTEKHAFQAEIQQLLDIVIHSLYTDKEIFVRELISNAADALEKLRFLQSSGQAIHQPEVPLAIAIATDEKEKTITFTDTGVGMTHAELIENLGTIAHSGSRAFLKKLAEGQQADARLIGQFGVGFYAAFMAASKVTVLTRPYWPEESSWRWTSEGAGGYEIGPESGLCRGTKVILDLKESEFARSDTVERIIRRYSNFVPFPIELNGKRVNTIQAIWTRPKNEVSEAEYNEFYQYIGHDQENPLYRLHFSADAPLAIAALLFVPARNFEALGLARLEPGVNLYSRKILIQAHAKGLFPGWLRFLKGAVDSEDLPLNISRQTMQDTALLQKLNRVLTGRFIKFLDEQAEQHPSDYLKFYDEHNRFLKEGVVSDFAHREALGKLLRFESSSLGKGEKTSFADYVKRMPSEQKEIFFLLAPNREAAENSPYFEVFRARKFEVLFLYDPWDEFVMEHVHEFDSKPLRSAEKANIALDELAKEGGEQLTDSEAEALAKWLKEDLGDKIGAVRVSRRLVASPAVLLDSDPFLTSTMRRILKSAGREAAESPGQHDLEINPRHPIMVRLEKTRQGNPDLARQVAAQTLDNTRLAAGLLEDPRAMVQRMNDLLAQLLNSDPAP